MERATKYQYSKTNLGEKLPYTKKAIYITGGLTADTITNAIIVTHQKYALDWNEMSTRVCGKE